MIGARARAPQPLDPKRREAIIRLLGVLLDGLPVAARRPMSPAGFASETDPYETGVARGHFNESQRRHERTRDRDREIDRIADQVAPPRSEAELLADADEHPFGWELERLRLREEFDVPALERALEVLRDVDADAYRAVFAVHVHCWVPEEGAAALLADRAVAFVDPWLPAELRAPAEQTPVGVSVSVQEALKAAHGNRDRAIRRLVVDADAAPQWVAGQFGLSVSQVNRIVAEKDVA